MYLTRFHRLYLNSYDQSKDNFYRQFSAPNHTLESNAQSPANKMLDSNRQLIVKNLSNDHSYAIKNPFQGAHDSSVKTLPVDYSLPKNSILKLDFIALQKNTTSNTTTSNTTTSNTTTSNTTTSNTTVKCISNNNQNFKITAKKGSKVFKETYRGKSKKNYRISNGNNRIQRPSMVLNPSSTIILNPDEKRKGSWHCCATTPCGSSYLNSIPNINDFRPNNSSAALAFDREPGTNSAAIDYEQVIQNWIYKLLANHNLMYSDQISTDDGDIKNMQQTLISFLKNEVSPTKNINDWLQTYEIEIENILKRDPIIFLDQRCLINADFFNLQDKFFDNLENKIVLANKFFIYLSMMRQGFKTHASWYASKIKGIFGGSETLSACPMRSSLKAYLQVLYAKIVVGQQKNSSINQAINSCSALKWHVFNKSLLLALLSEVKTHLTYITGIQPLINWLQEEKLEHVSFQKLLAFYSNKNQLYCHLSIDTLNAMTNDYVKNLQDSVFHCIYALSEPVKINCRK